MVWMIVLSRFQRYFCMQYTTVDDDFEVPSELFYQDFKDTFVCNTQRGVRPSPRIAVVLSGFQRYFCMQYTTLFDGQDTNECCFIRISMNNLLQKYRKNGKYANLYEYILLFQ